MSFLTRNLTLAVLFFLVACWALVFFLVPLERVVESIGVENTYLILFLLALLGGVSSFTSSTFYASVTVFSGGGADPVLLGLSGGSGMFLSDAVFYGLALHGRKMLPEKWEERASRLGKHLLRLPQWVVLGGVLLYTGFMPLPSDILMMALALCGYPFLKIAPFILLGDVTIVTLIAFLSH